MTFFGDEHDAYPPGSPKSPGYHERAAGWADARRKADRESMADQILRQRADIAARTEAILAEEYEAFDDD